MIKGGSIKYDKILGKGRYLVSSKAAMEKSGRPECNQILWQ